MFVFDKRTIIELHNMFQYCNESFHSVLYSLFVSNARLNYDVIWILLETNVTLKTLNPYDPQEYMMRKQV